MVSSKVLILNYAGKSLRSGQEVQPLVKLTSWNNFVCEKDCSSRKVDYFLVAKVHTLLNSVKRHKIFSIESVYPDLKFLKT